MPLIAALQPFAPGLVARRLDQNSAPPREPQAEQIHTAVLFSDISGFTALTERLAKRGARGAEDVKEVLDGCFGPLVDIIHRHGGAIEKFAGDATLALWPADEDHDLATCVARAAACCQEIRAELDGRKISDDFVLRLRLAITAGPAWLATTGGVDGRWETLVTGEALQQVAPAIRQAAPGQILLSPDAWDQVRERVIGEMVEDGCLRLDGLETPPPTESAPPLHLPAAALEALRSFVPNSVQERLQAGQTSWLAEFRRVSILFVRFGSFEVRNEASVDLLQHAFRAIQGAIYRFGGSVNQLVTDDKGNCVVAAWGLPARYWEDNAARAVRAAMTIEDALATLEVDGSLGLATGQIFTGPRGNLQRRDYAMIGDAVNLAARLMQSAGGGILCDAATRQAAAREIDFETLSPIYLKGKADRVEIFRPLARSKKSGARRQMVIGREAERAILADKLAQLLAGKSGTIWLEGEAGIGKSHLIADFLERAEDAGVRVISGSGDAIERDLAFHAWQPVFDRLFGFEPLLETQAESGAFSGRLRDYLPPELWDRAPLLDPVLPFDLPESPWVAGLTPKGRADARRELLIGILRRAAALGPTILVLEDAHWLDSSSWDLADAVHREVDGLLLVILGRNLREEDLTTESRRLRGDEAVSRLSLEALSDQEATELICSRLGVDGVPDALSRLVLDRAEGHPLFTEELIFNLRERGWIRTENGRCEMPSQSGSLELSLPDSAQGVVTGRIDMLVPQLQLTLKVASVLGRRFDPQILKAIHPIAGDRDAVVAHLESLSSLDLVLLDGDQPERGPYRFKHSITQEAAYELLPFAQRRELHRAVAEWHEGLGTPLDEIYALLAHHWTQAEAPLKALHYLELAGDQAAASYAYEEVARFFEKALALDAQLADAGPLDRQRIQLPGGITLTGRTARRARWERLLGDAKANLGRLEEGAGNLETMLRLLGRPLPTSQRAWQFQTFKLAMQQVGHRLFPSRNHRYHGEASECLLEASRALARLGSYYYVTNRRLQIAYALVSALNASELAQVSKELAIAYADTCNVAGLIPIHFLARKFVNLALKSAAEVDHPATTARVISRTSIYRYSIGDWEVERDLQHSVELAHRLGDPFQWEESIYLVSNVQLATGRLASAGELGRQLRERSRRSRTLIHEIWGTTQQAECSLFLGRLDESIDLAEESLELLRRSDANYSDSVIRTWGILAVAHLRRNEFDQALAAAEKADEEIGKLRRTGYIALQGHSGAADVYLTLIERRLGSKLADWRGVLPSETHELLAKAKTTCERLEAYGGYFLLAKVRAHLWKGRLLAIQGKLEKARKAWLEGLALAERLETPFDRALAHAQLARLPDSAAAHHHQQATLLFGELGLPWELEQLERAKA